jgi:hypothetical protein
LKIGFFTAMLRGTRWLFVSNFYRDSPMDKFTATAQNIPILVTVIFIYLSTPLDKLLNWWIRWGMLSNPLSSPFPTSNGQPTRHINDHRNKNILLITELHQP